MRKLSFMLVALGAFMLATPPFPSLEMDSGSASQTIALLLGSGLLCRFRRSR